MIITPQTIPVATILGSSTIGDLPSTRREVAASLQHLAPLDRINFTAAVNEVLTNAYHHGRPPVDVRLWVTPTGVECHITDRGPGFRDSTAGYLPSTAGDSQRAGAGLWLARHTCDELDTWYTSTTFTVRLAVALSPGLNLRHHGAFARAEAASSRANNAENRAFTAQNRAEESLARLRAAQDRTAVARQRLTDLAAEPYR